MKNSKIKRNLLLVTLFCIGTITGCAKSNAPLSAGQQNIAALAALPNANGGTQVYSDTVEMPGGNTDYTAYEQYGLIYDKESNCYTYNGDVVRFFNDPVAGASFTNFFTGTVDIEAERNTDNELIGIRECAKEDYDRHTKKYENSGLKSMPAGTSMESGNNMSNIHSLRDYEPYGVSYNSEDGYWYYNNQRICTFVDSDKAIVYFDDGGNIYLSISKNSEQGTMKIKEVSKADAQILLGNNNPGNSISFTTEED